MTPRWLSISRGGSPLLISLPHTGLDLAGLEPRLTSPWLARKDTDWWIERLYDFAGELGATIVRTDMSRTVIDVNRDPSGASLYPGQATTGLCPTTTFDGEPLYLAGQEPSPEEIATRSRTYFEPYHRALSDEIARLRAHHAHVALYDCHSIRSTIPRLFEGQLPVFNLGTNGGASAPRQLVDEVAGLMRSSGRSFVVDGRFKGGWITRHFGRPAEGVSALQMELACRGYMREPSGDVAVETWPSPYDPDYAAATRETLKAILAAVLRWAQSANVPRPS